MPVLMENPDMLDGIGAMLGDRVLIMGATRVERDGGVARAFYNSGFVIDGVDGEATIMQWHDKYRLTPFGEFIPLFNLISWLDIPTLQQIGNGFTAAPDPPRRLVVPGADDALILICYESIFPGLIVRGAERPSWLVNISVDAWYGDGTGPWQNDNQSRYRAIEEGLPMARAASGGVSAIVDAYGRRVVWVGREGGAVEAALPPPLPETVNVRFGALLTAALILLIGLLRFAPSGAAGRGFRS
jgi:apolipoprotein N-acyltransferase